MALNPNHTFEDLGDVKCAIVEKNCTPERTDFLKRLLEHNKYTVIIAKSPPPKAKPAPKPVEGAEAATPVPEAPPPPDTFTVGVTDLMFNPINAVFNRTLKTINGEIVSSNYWKQLEPVPSEEWYWKK